MIFHLNRIAIVWTLLLNKSLLLLVINFSSHTVGLYSIIYFNIYIYIYIYIYNKTKNPDTHTHIHSHSRTHILTHTRTRTITQGGRFSWTLWHIDYRRLFRGRRVIKNKNKQTKKKRMYIHIRHEHPCTHTNTQNTLLSKKISANREITSAELKVYHGQ